MYFRVDSVIAITIGLFLVVFARDIAALMLKLYTTKIFNGTVARSLLFVWPIRFIGIISIVSAFLLARSSPSWAGLKSDMNRIALLENGIVTTGSIVKSYYQRLASAGWTVIYDFDAKDPKTGKNKTYSGSSQGPAKYYTKLSEGNKIDVIYEPSNPKINSEIKCFLNNPGYRQTFKKAGKLNLLDKFRDKYEFEDYSFVEWYNQQQ